MIDLEYLDEFCNIYSNRPIKKNTGGMGFNHSFALFSILKKLKPELVIESGVWRGHSTYIIEKALPKAEIVSLDVNLKHRKYISNNSTYFETDFNNIDWSNYKNINKSICFFDDHQNSLERLKEMKWWGFTRAIFEDNFPTGEGDSYSLKQIIDCSGHPNIELSEKYQPSRKKERFKRRFEEIVLNKYYFRQNMIVRPNKVDKKGFELNIKNFVELPPVISNKTNIWEKEWNGNYSKLPDLINKKNLKDHTYFSDYISNNKEDFEYSFITYVELN